MTNAVDSKKNI